MSNESLVLALDLGTTFTKVGVVNIGGEIISKEIIPSKVIITKENGVEQSPDDWWKDFLSASKKILKKKPELKKNIKYISITTHWSGTVCIDKAGNSIRNAIIWMDTRGSEVLKKTLSTFPTIQGYNMYKLWNLIRITGGAPGFSGKDSISHILYIKENEKKIYEETYKFLEPKDYINFKLTGKIFTSYETITLHWVTDNRNINKIVYHPKLLKFFGIPIEKLPSIIKPASIVGPVLHTVAKELDISKETLVVSGAPDLQSAAIGASAILDYDCHIYLGTSSWITCHLPYKKTDLFHNMATLPSAIPGKYFLANEQEVSGYCLTYFFENIINPRDRLSKYFSLSLERDQVYQIFEEIAKEVPVGSNGLIFTPWLNGERTPIENSYLRGGFHNLSLTTTRADMIRALMEGVALNSKWLFGYIQKFINRKISKLTFIGGGAKSNLWSQILADVLNVRILQVKSPDTINIKGAGLLAFLSVGLIKGNEIPNTLQIENEYEPKSENVKIYDELFKEFLEIYKKNKKIYKRLNTKRWK